MILGEGGARILAQPPAPLTFLPGPAAASAHTDRLGYGAGTVVGDATAGAGGV
jgi:hypothetical protein